MKILIQASTFNALMLGNFDETVSVKDFLHHADTDIGTYIRLDGEAILRTTWPTSPLRMARLL